MTKVNTAPRTDFSGFSDLELTFYAIEELRKRGYYIFIGEPEVDFNPEEFNPKAADSCLNIAFSEAVQTMDAEPISDDED